MWGPGTTLLGLVPLPLLTVALWAGCFVNFTVLVCKMRKIIVLPPRAVVRLSSMIHRQFLEQSTAQNNASIHISSYSYFIIEEIKVDFKNIF